MTGYVELVSGHHIYIYYVSIYNFKKLSIVLWCFHYRNIVSQISKAQPTSLIVFLLEVNYLIDKHIGIPVFYFIIVD